MLGSNGGSWPVESSEDDSSLEFTIAHVVKLGGAIDDVVDSLKCEVHGHELYHGSESHECSAAADACEPCLGDGCVPEALRSPLVNKSFRYLVCAMVVGDLLAHDEHLLVSGELLVKSSVQCFSVGDFLGEVSDEVFGDALKHSIL